MLYNNYEIYEKLYNIFGVNFGIFLPIFSLIDI
jgi:hypothetical protein